MSTTTPNAAPTITIDQLTRELESGGIAELWNALTDDYFTGEMIPGSRRVPVDHVGREISASALPKDTAIVVYCSGPSCPNSRQAGDKLVAFGFTNVRVFEGGLEVWKAAGRGVEQLASAAA
jgi:rhodanese-related sulfurtransferase